jgi:hypothetical protein
VLVPGPFGTGLRDFLTPKPRAAPSPQAEDEAQGRVDLAEFIEAELPGRLSQALRIRAPRGERRR